MKRLRSILLHLWLWAPIPANVRVIVVYGQKGNPRMKRLTSILACVLLAGAASAGNGYMKQITFSGYTKTETLTNFPALVTFTNYTGFLSTNGYDLRFWTNSAAIGTPLNYEIDSWTNPGTSYTAPSVVGSHPMAQGQRIHFTVAELVAWTVPQ